MGQGEEEHHHITMVRRPHGIQHLQLCHDVSVGEHGPFRRTRRTGCVDQYGYVLRLDLLFRPQGQAGIRLQGCTTLVFQVRQTHEIMLVFRGVPENRAVQTGELFKEGGELFHLPGVFEKQPPGGGILQDVRALFANERGVDAYAHTPRTKNGQITQGPLQAGPAQDGDHIPRLYPQSDEPGRDPVHSFIRLGPCNGSPLTVGSHLIGRPVRRFCPTIPEQVG